VVAILIAGLAISPAHASPGAEGHALHHASPPIAAALSLLALGALCAGAAIRGRKAAVLPLAFLVAVFGLESAVHSVHHLGDAQAAASCAVSSASHHSPGAFPETSDAASPVWRPVASAPLDAEAGRPLQAFRCPEGRAPPTPLSA